MHIPDGFLSTPVWATLDLASAGAVAIAAKRARVESDQSKVPLLGVMGAFVFAAQMINFPVGPGTSGHLVGGALLAIALGAPAAMIVMTAILVVQAFVFQDGGIVVLGANIFNMAIAGVLAGYLPYRMLGRTRSAIFVGGVLSVLTSACLALSELLISGVKMPRQMLLVSLALFVVSAAIEGAITVAALSAIARLNPNLARHEAGRMPSRAIAIVAIAAVVLAVGGILIASAAPDGIWSLAGKLGLAARSPVWLRSPFAEYEVKGLDSPYLRKAVAGLAGLLMIWTACMVAGRFLNKRSA